MKIVLDTNVLISGIFFKGIPYEILKSWRDGHIQFVLSPEILAEYTEVAKILKEKYVYVDVQEIIDLLLVKTELIKSYKLDQPISKDPDDDKFLACALSSKTKIIVTGDKHLLDLHGYENLEIITPRKFNDKYLNQPKA